MDCNRSKQTGCQDDEKSNGNDSHVKPENNEDKNIDKGWAWVIFVSTFCNFFLCGLMYMPGTFNVLFLELYNESKAKTAWCGGLQIGISGLAGPLASYLNNKIGPRITMIIGGLFCSLGYALTYFAQSINHVMITFGVMVGLGFALTYTSSLMALSFYFKVYRNMAFGCTLVGLGIGSMVFPIMVEYFLEYYGLGGTMLIIGGIYTHAFIIGGVTRPFPGVKKQRENNVMNGTEMSSTIHWIYNKDEENISGTEDNTPSTCACKGYMNILKEKWKASVLYELMSSINFIIYCLHLLIYSLAFYCLYVHLPAYFSSIGVNSNVGSKLVSVMAAGSIVCRLVTGVISNTSKNRTLALYIGTSFIAGLLSMIYPYIGASIYAQGTFMFLLSFIMNTYLVLMIPVVIDLVGLDKSITTSGITVVMHGIGSLVGPIIGGLLFDYTHTYFYIFPYACVCFFSAGTLMLLIPVKRRCKRNKVEQTKF